MSNKIIDRYNMQKGKDSAHLKSESDPIDNYINSHLQSRKMVQEQTKNVQEKRIEKKQIQEIQKEILKQIEQQVKDTIEKNLKNLL